MKEINLKQRSLVHAIVREANLMQVDPTDFLEVMVPLSGLTIFRNWALEKHEYVVENLKGEMLDHLEKCKTLKCPCENSGNE